MITRAIAVKIRKTITPTIKQEVKLSFANEFIDKKNKITGIKSISPRYSVVPPTQTPKATRTNAIAVKIERIIDLIIIKPISKKLMRHI